MLFVRQVKESAKLISSSVLIHTMGSDKRTFTYIECRETLTL